MGELYPMRDNIAILFKLKIIRVISDEAPLKFHHPGSTGVCRHCYQILFILKPPYCGLLRLWHQHSLTHQHPSGIMQSRSYHFDKSSQYLKANLRIILEQVSESNATNGQSLDILQAYRRKGIDLRFDNG